MAETPKEIVQNLALDELTDDDKRKQVEAYFREKKEDIQEVSKGKREEMQEVMREMNRAKAGPDKIIETILVKLFSSNLEQKVRGKYADMFADVTLAESINLVGDDDTKEELNANPVFQKARAKIIMTIHSGITQAEQQKQKFLKAEYADEYAKAVVDKYVKDMDEEITGRVSESNVENDLKPLIFNDWLMAHPEHTDEKIFHSFSLAEAKGFIADVAAVRSELGKVKTDDKNLDARLSEYFKKEKEKVESDMMSKPENTQKVLETAGALAVSFASVQGVAKMKTDLEARLNDAAGLRDKLPDFDASIEEGYKKLQTDLDAAIAQFVEKKGQGQLDVKTKDLEDLDKKLAAEKERAQKQAAEQEKTEQAAAAEADEKAKEGPDPLNDPDGWLEQMGKEAGPFGSILVAFLAGSPLFERFKKFIGKIKDKVGMKDAAKEAPRIAAFQSFAKEKFDLNGEEASILAEMKVEEILKASRSPAKVRQKPYVAFVAALKYNGAKESTIGTVLDFTEKNRSDWKDVPAEEPQGGEAPEEP